MKQKIKEIIENKVLIKRGDDNNSIGFWSENMRWIFDFRAVLLEAVFLDMAAEMFWERFKDQYPFQVGGQETAAISLVAAIVLKGSERGTPVSGFYIRKSRKPEGLQKIIEGQLTNAPIILVDDLINRGSTLLRQIEVLKRCHKKVENVFVFVRFRDVDAYTFLKKENITLTTLFDIKDFNLSLKETDTLPAFNSFKVSWLFQASKPNYFYRVPKSSPVLDEDKVYFGSDDGVLHAIKQADGTLVWEFKIFGFGSKGKTIFSSPALSNKTIFFGAYDGNFYAVDTTTGKKRWVYMDADWIGSSPCIAQSHGLVFVGLEYGLWKKRGGVVALDVKTGEKRWEYITMPSLTHGSPAYSEKYNVIGIGSNNGVFYLFRADTGLLLWEFPTTGDIKYIPTFDEKRGYVLFGSFDGGLYIVDILTGKLMHVLNTTGPIYSEPLVYDGRVYVSSLDKSIYCVNLDTFVLEWSYETSGRIFASPTIVEGVLYVGSNDGRLYGINPVDGKNLSVFQVTERITNKVAENKDTKKIFLLTYANELYCIEKTNDF